MILCIALLIGTGLKECAFCYSGTDSKQLNAFAEAYREPTVAPQALL